MATTTYTLETYADGAAVEEALDKASSAVQPGDLGTAASAATTDFAPAQHAASHAPTGSDPLAAYSSTGLAVALAIVFGA